MHLTDNKGSTGSKYDHHLCRSCGYSCDCGDKINCDICAICHASGQCDCESEELDYDWD